MHDVNVTVERPPDARAQVRVCRLDGSEVSVRLRLLGYDGCEFECSERFDTGEQISIHIYRMGWIRARILSLQSGIVEAEFDKDCPV
jgi:hypothetical protein